MPAVDKRRVTLLLPIRVIVKMDRAAKLVGGISRNAIATLILDSGTADVELTQADIDEIKAEMEANLAARKKR